MQPTTECNHPCAVHFTPQVGLKQQDVIEVVALGAIAAPMFALKGPTMAARTYSPAFPLKHQQKDIRLALALG